MNHVDNPFYDATILSFCPGFLGLERGLTRAFDRIWGNNSSNKDGKTVQQKNNHIKVAAYVEIEAFICANLVAGMEAGILDAAPVWTDLKTFDAQFFHTKIQGNNAK